MRTTLTMLVTAAVLTATAGLVTAQPAARKTDDNLRIKAKAALVLTCGDKAECHLIRKAELALVAAKQEVLAPRKLPTAPPPRTKGCDDCPDCPDCKTCPGGTCPPAAAHPVIPGYTRGADGVYRPTGVAVPRVWR